MADELQTTIFDPVNALSHAAALRQFMGDGLSLRDGLESELTSPGGPMKTKRLLAVKEVLCRRSSWRIGSQQTLPKRV